MSSHSHRKCCVTKYTLAFTCLTLPHILFVTRVPTGHGIWWNLETCHLDRDFNKGVTYKQSAWNVFVSILFYTLHYLLAVGYFFPITGRFKFTGVRSQFWTENVLFLLFSKYCIWMSYVLYIYVLYKWGEIKFHHFRFGVNWVFPGWDIRFF